MNRYRHPCFTIYDCVYKYSLLYVGRVEDEFPATRANICIFMSICTINYLYHDQ